MLDKSDIKTIKGLLSEQLSEQKEGIIEEVKDIVDFAIEKSGMRTNDKLNKIDREINDLIETNQEFLTRLGDQEGRIRQLEVKTHLRQA